jgi:hypothetical protein
VKSIIVLMLVLIALAGCKAADEEASVEPTQALLDQASGIEKASAASLPVSNPPEKSEDSGVIQEEREDESAGDVEIIAPSGSVNLNDLTPVNETVLPEEDAVVQPAPGVPNSKAKVEQIAIQDLAAYLGVRAEDVEANSGEEVEWSDGSLGCPEKDLMYIQVITPGYLFVLEVDGLEYEYHTDQQDQVILCIDGRPAGQQAPAP